jgi:NADP-dependent 3-hydroxy acid dehydrogenase YdfG
MASDSHSFYLVGRSKTRLEEVCSLIESAGGTAIYGIGDVSVVADVDSHYSEAVEKLGEIDVLVANAGVGYFGNLEDMTPEQFDEQFGTNVRGVFLWMRKVLPSMKMRNSGQIIVTSSNLGLNTSARTSIYSGTKHAVQAMVSCVRDELKGTRVKAATINPGSVSTPWFDGKDVDRSKMLQASDVAQAARLIIDQSESSNIDHILLMPGRA